MAEASLIIAVAACLAAVLAAWYAFYAYRSQRHEVIRARFVQQRQDLGARRPELTRAALAYHATTPDDRLPGMLTIPPWVPDAPIPLQRLSVTLAPAAAPGATTTRLRHRARSGLPRKKSLQRYASYSEALGELARPSLFEDLACYPLSAADLRSDVPTMTVGLTTFFAGIDESEALAHEFAAQPNVKGGITKETRYLPARSLVSDPFRVSQRTTLMSVSCLTLRVGGSEATFYLHARDASAVAIAGNLLHLAPSGIFQPSADDQDTVDRDCAPWLTVCREFAEEFLGVEEARGAVGAALSYEDDEPYASITRAYGDGRLRVYVCGIGLDPLTLCAELVTIAMIDSESFDEIFSGLVVQNREGNLRGRRISKGRIEGFRFNQVTVGSFLGSDRLSPAARAALAVAWRCRSSLGLEGR